VFEERRRPAPSRVLSRKRRKKASYPDYRPGNEGTSWPSETLLQSAKDSPFPFGSQTTDGRRLIGRERQLQVTDDSVDDGVFRQEDNSLHPPAAL
jgi:hypothetical protein